MMILLVLTTCATSTAPSESLTITSDLLEDAGTATEAELHDLDFDTTSRISPWSLWTTVVKVLIDEFSADKASNVTVTSSENVTVGTIDAADDATFDFTGVTGTFGDG